MAAVAPVREAITVPPVAADLKQRAESMGIRLTPLHRHLGVQVDGLDIKQPLSKEQQDLLIDVWLQHDLLLFRGQELRPEDEQRMLMYFPHDRAAIEEERFCNSFFRQRVPSNPLLVVRGTNIDLEDHWGLDREQLRSVGGQSGTFNHSLVWHMDGSHMSTPPEVSAMYMVMCPPTGGDTVFASTAVGYQQLDEDTKKLVLRLGVVNPATVVQNLQVTEDGTRRIDDIDASWRQAKEMGLPEDLTPRPLVIVDPKTRRRSLLMNVLRVRHFVDLATGEEMSLADSQDLLQRLLKAVTAESERFTMKWQPNDFVIWSNRRLIHSSTPEKRYNGMTRLFHLVFLDSDAPLHTAED